jgi:hypothetical protein
MLPVDGAAGAIPTFRILTCGILHRSGVHQNHSGEVPSNSPRSISPDSFIAPRSPVDAGTVIDDAMFARAGERDDANLTASSWDTVNLQN